jgi:hypothetical protein
VIDKIVLATLDPLEIVKRFPESPDGHYVFDLPNGDHVRGATLGWKSSNLGLFELKVTKQKGTGEPVGHELSVKGKKLIWKVKYE